MANLGHKKTILYESVWVIGFVFFCATGMALLLATRLQRLISEPILTLAATARQVADYKDYALQAVDHHTGELGLLVNEFNQMLRKIQARDAALVEAKERLENYSNELAAHRDHLEKLVDERTIHLQNAYEEIRAFVFMFSHDLRTPLVNIKGFTGELNMCLKRLSGIVQEGSFSSTQRKELSQIISTEIPEATSFIQEASSSMDTLINAMLKMSFLGRRELAISLIRSENLVNKMLSKMAETIEGKNVDIEIGTLPTLEADAQSLEQIFEHILSNALAYLHEERRGEVHIWGEVGEDAYFFHVRDNGRGIATNEIPKVFEPFRRLGRQGVAGQGMGMVYAKTLVNRHGGQIWCTSRENVGSTFSFSINKNTSLFDAYSPLGT